MTAEEYAARRGGEMPPSFPYVRPEDVAVVVVEDGDDIVGCMTVLKVTHFEGVWVDPKYRGNAGVMRPLLRQAWAIPRARGESWAFGGAAVGDGAMGKFMGKLNGVQLPLHTFALWVGEEGSCPKQE